MGDFKVIETQEQLEEVLRDRLRRERETTRKEFDGFLSPDAAAEKYKGYLSPEDVEAKFKDHLSPDEASKLRAKIKGYETDSVKTRIAHETGLSYDAIQFLRGEDEESIRKSAESLKGLVGMNNVAPLASTEQTLADSNEVALKKMVRNLSNKGE